MEMQKKSGKGQNYRSLEKARNCENTWKLHIQGTKYQE